MDTDLGLDLGFNSNGETLGADDINFSFFEPLEETNSSTTNAAHAAKPYHTKRPHKKSRAGCKACKSRKVKCDEDRPTCRACKLRREKCVYPEATSSSGPSSSKALSSAPSPARSTSSTATKSRDGCKACKSRKVKCDEERPTCRACSLRREKCIYPMKASSFTPSPAASPYLNPVSRSSNSSKDLTLLPQDRHGCPDLMLTEPLFIPAPVTDDVDMRMLWFYTIEAYHSISIESGRSETIDKVLKVKIMEHAFQSPFLMNSVLGLAALNLEHLGQPVPQWKLASYQARAFEGYRTAIEQAKPADYPALLACSLMMCALSSQMFREEEKKKLYIVEWMAVWRGIGLIIEIISPQAVQDSGLAMLFYRPPIDLEKAAKHVPNNILFMVTSISPGDSDYEHQQTYYEVLKYLGSLYMELNHGFGPILDLKVITFFTFIPKDFIPLAKEHRPRALIILAYYLCFTKMNRVWWMQGLDREIGEICEAVDDGWEHLLRIPKKVTTLRDKLEIGQTIKDNYNWTPEEENLYEKHIEGRTKYDLRLINDEGEEVQIEDGKWMLKASGLFWEKLKLSESQAPEYLPGEETLLGIRQKRSPRTASSTSHSDNKSSPSDAASSSPNTN